MTKIGDEVRAIYNSTKRIQRKLQAVVARSYAVVSDSGALRVSTSLSEIAAVE